MTFDEAATVLADPLAATAADPDHSRNELRWITIGMSNLQRVLIVSHTEETDIIRVISARKATRSEREIYENDQDAAHP